MVPVWSLSPNYSQTTTNGLSKKWEYSENRKAAKLKKSGISIRPLILVFKYKEIKVTNIVCGFLGNILYHNMVNKTS